MLFSAVRSVVTCPGPDSDCLATSSMMSIASVWLTALGDEHPGGEEHRRQQDGSLRNLRKTHERSSSRHIDLKPGCKGQPTDGAVRSAKTGGN
jgi:hypothetical protein